MWRDNRLTVDWDEVDDRVAELRELLEDLYRRGIDMSKVSYWTAAHDLIAEFVEPNIASRWRREARVVTDEATFAWVCDVFVDESCRGQGIGKRLMQAIVDDPRLAGLKRMVLATSSPGFYEPFGFARLEKPERWMLRPGPGPAD